MNKIPALKLGLLFLASLGILASVTFVYPPGQFSFLSALLIFLAFLLAGLLIILTLRGILAASETSKP